MFSLPKVEDDLSSIGKHYLVEGNGADLVKRQFTVVRCLEKGVYEGLIDGIKSKGKVRAKESQIGKGGFQVAVKNYKVVGGLSEAMHRSLIGDMFTVRGILGKSLGLAKHGDHVAFVAGTGVLVFLDLVGLISKHHIGHLRDSHDMPIFSEGSTFKLILYASFASDSEAIGLDLLRALQASNPSNFELHLRISSQTRSSHAEGSASTRWDPAFIRKELLSKGVGSLAKVYVCGPPNMTEMFERTLGEMIQAKIVRRDQIDIM